VAVAIGLPIHRLHVDHPTRWGLANMDLFGYFHPTVKFIHDELGQGRLPLWNPYQYAGQPFLAFHTTGALYPPNLFLFSLFEPGRGLEAHFTFHIAVAGVFTWLLAGRLGLQPIARLAAASAYMLSGPLLLGLSNICFLATEAWLPAVLWSLHGLLREARARWAVALAVFLALAFLGGQAQQSLYTLQFGLVCGVFGLYFLSAPGTRIRIVALAALAGVLAFGLVAPQLLPAVEFASESIRGLGGISFEDASIASIEPSVLLRGLTGVSPWDEPLLSSVVRLPLLALPLALVALMAHRDRRQAVFLAVAAAICGLFVLGSHGPVFPLYFSLPLGDLFRVPSRMAFLYQLLFSLLLAMGIDATVSKLRGSRFGRGVGSAVAVALLLVVFVSQYHHTRARGTHPALEPQLPSAPEELVRFARSRPDHPRVFVQISRQLTAGGLLLKAGMMNRFFVVPDYEPNMPMIYTRYFDRDFPWPGLLTATRGLPEGGGPELARRLDLMSVRYYATLHRPRRRGGTRLEGFLTGDRVDLGNLRLFERPEAVARAYPVRRVEIVPDLDAAFVRILQPEFQPREAAVVLEGDWQDPAQVLPAECEAGPDTSAIESVEPTEVVVTTSCPCGCLSVLTDLHYPGWRVQVDGIEKTMHRVNAIFRGVKLEPGVHRVVYRYDPDSLRAGWIALVVAPLIALAGLWLMKDRQRSADQRVRTE
jgi:hypothetical protein